MKHYVDRRALIIIKSDTFTQGVVNNVGERYDYSQANPTQFLYVISLSFSKRVERIRFADSSFLMTTFRTENRHGYSLKFSPNRSDLLAIATSQYYGFKGGGTLFLVTYDGEKCSITVEHEMHWEDGLFDVVWSRSVDSVLVTGSGDGTVQMWNYKFPQVMTIGRHGSGPMRNYVKFVFCTRVETREDIRRAQERSVQRRLVSKFHRRLHHIRVVGLFGETGT